MRLVALCCMPTPLVVELLVHAAAVVCMRAPHYSYPHKPSLSLSPQDYKRQEAIAKALHEQAVLRAEAAERQRLIDEEHARIMEKKQAALAIRVGIAKTVARLEAESREIMRQHAERVAAAEGPARQRREAAIEAKRNKVLQILLDIDSDEFLNCMDEVVALYGEVRAHLHLLPCEFSLFSPRPPPPPSYTGSHGLDPWSSPVS
jgi:hypothetical protein